MTEKLPGWAQQFAVFDTETTGTNVFADRIVTASIAVLNSHEQVTERSDWIINPGVPIPPAASAVHKITDEIAQRDGADPAQAVAVIVAKLGELASRGIPVCAFNATFDLSLLREEAARHGIAWPTSELLVLDPLVIDRAQDRFRKGKRTLGVLASHYGVSLDNAHTAGDDAIAAGAVLLRLAVKYYEQLNVDIFELQRLQKQWHTAWATNFEEWLNRQGKNEVINKDWPLRQRGEAS